MLLIIRILEFLHYFCNKVLLGICILHHTYQGYKVALMTRQNYARVQNRRIVVVTAFWFAVACADNGLQCTCGSCATRSECVDLPSRCILSYAQRACALSHHQACQSVLSHLGQLSFHRLAILMTCYPCTRIPCQIRQNRIPFSSSSLPRQSTPQTWIRSRVSTHRRPGSSLSRASKGIGLLVGMRVL